MHFFYFGHCRPLHEAIHPESANHSAPLLPECIPKATNFTADTTISAFNSNLSYDRLFHFHNSLTGTRSSIESVLEQLDRLLEQKETLMARFTSIVTQSANGVKTITLNRPDKRNALSPLLIEELTQALREAETCDCGVVILTGAGSAFCAGLDMEQLETIHARTP